MIYYLFNRTTKHYSGKVVGNVQPENSTSIEPPENMIDGIFNGTSWEKVIVNPSVNDGSPQDKSLTALGLQVASLTLRNAELSATNKQLNTSLQNLGLQVASMIVKKEGNYNGSNV